MFASNADVQIHYTDTGGDGTPVVFAHGFFMDGSQFDPQLPLVNEGHYRIIRWDARGHGQTEAPAGQAFTYWDLASDCLAVMDHAGVDTAVIAGMSQGGYVALRVALAAPERVQSLILLDTAADASTPEEKGDYASLFSGWCDPEVPLMPMALQLAPRLIGGTEADQIPWINKWLNSDRLRIREAGDNLINRDSILDRLDEITCPALVLRGDHDPTSTAQKSADMASRLVGARGLVTTVADAGHAANWTHPKPTNAALSEFLFLFGTATARRRAAA
ncbi:alpha/beta fold hydrolase [Nocardia sp. NPDC127526]|uniref:alpha/beta fold hydrolase n=1 Tax=Nocardia sp. NPDC127526 TaxID=3345393 RepID=UPI0036276699